MGEEGGDPWKPRGVRAEAGKFGTSLAPRPLPCDPAASSGFGPQPLLPLYLSLISNGTCRPSKALQWLPSVMGPSSSRQDQRDGTRPAILLLPNTPPGHAGALAAPLGPADPECWGLPTASKPLLDCVLLEGSPYCWVTRPLSAHPPPPAPGLLSIPRWSEQPLLCLVQAPP